MKKTFTCIVCPVGCKLFVDGDTITGNRCQRGFNYATQEIKDPKRVVTTTVATSRQDHPRLSVKTDKPISKPLMLEVVKVLRTIVIDHDVKIGDVIVPLILNTDVNIVATDNYFK